MNDRASTLRVQPTAPKTPRDERRVRWSLPIARVAGVTVRVHAAFLVLVWLVAVSASSVGESVLEAIGWLAALFACVVVHELSHSLVAQRKGIAVHEIELLPIGGVSRLERIPEDWREELEIAVVGPLASVGVGAVAFALAALHGDPLLHPDLAGGPLLARLAWVNLMLAGFNLLPAFPLDGGRVLRAWFERTYSRVDATRRAVRASRLIAAAMIGVGLAFNFWLVLIGFFVVIAGGAEEGAVLMHAALSAAPARLLAKACPTVLPAAMPARHAIAVVDKDLEPAYPVVDADGAYRGLVTWRLIVDAPPHAVLADIASATVVDSSTDLETVAELVRESPVAVSDRGRFVGAITPRALEAYLARVQAGAARAPRTG